ncbi:MAG: restriction endonuclease [Candidatus Promineifilaceae bacterium]
MSEVSIPTYDRMMNPLIQALNSLGGSGTIEELDDKVADILKLSDEQLEVMHNPKSGQTEVSYRLAWTRTYLKKYGILENSTRGVWALTKEGQQIDKVNPREVTKFVRDQTRKDRAETDGSETIEEELQLDWQEELLSTLQEMDPAAFERLVQRLLRESGFIQVEVTGRSGDGGIDGKGIMRLGGLLSFNVIFQCKRYSGSVGAGHVRDFRGAMVGRADKALLLTTGTFTRDAEREATRDGAPTIDLIDGNLLSEKLKELSLGVETKIVQREQVEIDREWFLGL